MLQNTLALQDLILHDPNINYRTFKWIVSIVYGIAETNANNNFVPVTFILHGHWQYVAEIVRDAIIIIAKEQWCIQVGLDHINTISDPAKQEFINNILKLKEAKANADMSKLYQAYSYFWQNHHNFYDYLNTTAPELPRPTQDSEILRQCSLKWGFSKDS